MAFSEHLVPMKREEWSFFDKQRSIFSSMHSDMDDEWKSFDMELDKIKRDMFKLTPMDMGDFGSSLMPSLGSGFDKSLDSSSSSSKMTKKTTTTTTKTTKMTSSKGSADPMSSLESSFGSSMNTSFGSSMDSNIDAALMDAGFGSGFGSTALDTSSRSSSAIDKYMLKVDQPFVTDMDGKKKLSLKFDMSEFKPEEISLKTVDNRLMIGAKHLEETATSKIYREFSKQYVLPVKIDPISLSSILSKDGVLSIEAPAPDSVEAPREKILPIQRLL
ncbi:uncharacterized protein LOC124272107 [Haliotis rubra]|uniref:uncharacterized protein LOC124272107 n=1 Tax=Haliotis rubra TaxID=36100 RepID=UPI001EE57BF6|nr:uncharacterized protein LOC124272107 [Haliotis rubra]